MYEDSSIFDSKAEKENPAVPEQRNNKFLWTELKIS